MAAKVYSASFDLNDAGLNASRKARNDARAVPYTSTDDGSGKAVRGEATSSGLVFTDDQRDFTDEGVTTSHRIQIVTDEGNLQRDEVISAVGTTTITVGGTAFDEDVTNVEYVIYLPPSDSDIATDPSKRGTGTVGYEEWITKVFAEETATFPTDLVDISYAESLRKQIMILNA